MMIIGRFHTASGIRPMPIALAGEPQKDDVIDLGPSERAADELPGGRWIVTQRVWEVGQLTLDLKPYVW
jgi:hypothetical protein